MRRRMKTQYIEFIRYSDKIGMYVAFTQNLCAWDNEKQNNKLDLRSLLCMAYKLTYIVVQRKCSKIVI